MQCSNCFTSITDVHSSCSTCGKPIHNDCVAKCIECGKVLCDTCMLANKFKCKECVESNQIDLPFMTRSMYELYETCPYAFYLRYIKKIPEKENAWAWNGTLLHSLFDKYSITPELTEEDMYAEYRKAYREADNDMFETMAHRESIYTKGLKAIKTYFKEEAMMPYPVATEQIIIEQIGEDIPPTHITLDRLNGTLGQDDLHLVDYKTGKVHVGKKLQESLQPSIYAMVIKQHYGFLPKTIKFLFLGEEKIREYTRRDDNTYVCMVNKNSYELNLRNSLQKMKSIYSKIRNQHFSIPDGLSNYTCEKMCYYGKSGICKGGFESKW